MTAFGITLLSWARSNGHNAESDGFTLGQVSEVFRHTCTRKMTATIKGAVVAGYLKSIRKDNGLTIYWVCESGTRDVRDLITEENLVD